MNDIRQGLRSFIVTHFLFGEAGNLSDDTSFLETGTVDSTGVLELVAHMESAYGFKVEDDELIPENLDSIDSLVAFVERKRPSDAAS